MILGSYTTRRSKAGAEKQKVGVLPEASLFPGTDAIAQMQGRIFEWSDPPVPVEDGWQQI